MQARISSTLALAALTALIAAGDARALGFGRAPTSVAMGRALDFAVPVRLEPGEFLNADCASVEVLHGEQRLAQTNLRLRVEAGTNPDERVLRVQSLVSIDEPVVTVVLNIACGTRLSRRFTALVDPPDFQAAIATAPPLVVVPPEPVEVQSQPAAAEPPAPAAPQGRAAVVAMGPGLAAASGLTSQTAAAGPPKRVRRKKAPRVETDMVSTKVARATVAPRPRGAARATAEPSHVVVPESWRARSGGARLRLEAADPELLPATAASGVQSTGPIFSELASAIDLAAATERVRTLEKGIEQLRSEVKASRELMQQMNTRLVEAKSADRWAPWFGAGLAAVAALSLALGWRLRKLQAQQQAQWWAPAEAERESAFGAQPTGAAALITHPTPRPSEPEDKPAAAPRPVPASPPGAATRAVTETGARLRSDPTPASLRVEPAQAETRPREMASDELIDLEQQADFFIALGQQDAAIDLLLSNLRGSGGTNPMPYLKLMEIYRHAGEQASYERMRERFNDRFNSVAPPMAADLRQGRSLEDYPAVLERLARAWPHAIDAMADIESLLFRRDGGEKFDLPAYRELLFLYVLTRDLIDTHGGAQEAVDVLLPLGNSASGAAAAARPAVLTVSSAGATDLASFELPSAIATTVDFELGDDPEILHIDVEPQVESSLDSRREGVRAQPKRK